MLGQHRRAAPASYDEAAGRLRWRRRGAPGADRKPSISTDASILADQIEFAVQEGLEELGVTADQADEIIRQLYNRPDMLKEALANGLYDYKKKLGMTGRPKPRSI